MWYSRRPGQLLRQAVGDLFAVAWTAAWVLVGRLVYGLVDALTTPARALGEAGLQYRQTVEDASRRVDDVPLVGSQIAEALKSVAVPGGTVSDRAQDAVDTLHHLAWALGLTTSLTPIILFVGPWLLLRWRFASRARAARQLVRSQAGIELLALRALTRRPMSQLADGGVDLADGWRRGDVATMRRLADLELRACGLPRVGDPGSECLPSGSADSRRPEQDRANITRS